MIHHKNKKITKIINLTIECLTNASFFYIVIFISKFYRISIFPNMLILYYGIIYVSVHIINFSLFGNDAHKKHHNEKYNKYYNYGPDSIDHIMNTKL